MKPVSWPALLTGALATMVSTAPRADLWSLDSSLESRLETSDNSSLSPTPAGSVNTWSLSSSLHAARRAENSATRINADITAVQQWGSGATDRFDGRLGVVHSYSDPRNSASVGLTLAQDFNSDVLTADVTQSRGQRRTTSLSAGWSYSLSERLSTTTQLSAARVGYGQELTQATDYRNSSLTLGVNYLLSETEVATVQLSHGDYQTLSGSNRSTTDSFELGFSRTFSERASASLNVGVYQTRSSALSSRLACPLQVSFCEAGLVPFIVITEAVGSSRTGLQFSSSARYQFDEVSGLTFSAARQPSPSGADSVVLNDSLSIGVNRSFSPTLSGSLSYGQSHSSLLGGTGVAPAAQKSILLSLSQQLQSNLSLQAGYRHNVSDGTGGGGERARENSVHVTLKYDWAKIEASR